MSENTASTDTDFLSQAGPMLQLVRSVDWSQTSVGHPSAWPQSLRSALSICFNSNFPIAIYWGSDLVLMYNDAWSPIPGDKNPWAFGKRAIEVWPEIWDDIEPQFQKAFAGAPGGSKDALLPMQRHGYTEECYFDFTFTPVYGASGKVEGIFNAVIETTYRVINERRGATLQRLTEAIGGLTSEADVFAQTIQVLNDANKDVPFFLMYEVVAGECLLRAHTKSITNSSGANWPFDNVLASATLKVIDNLNGYLPVVPHAYWPETPHEALILPLKSKNGDFVGFLVGGASARRKVDKEYKSFYQSVANIICGELDTLQSLIKERERAESLAQIDKAKTIFFSNISHEFRTPLTLMVSPLQEVLDTATNLTSAHRGHLETSLRNTFRLQKLVNTLLDFSKIEAGKLDPNVQYTVLDQVTKELASSFRSAIESAGIEYEVSAGPIENPVQVDIEMWEKIVLNLISNAFKYTEKGKIAVKLFEDDRFVKLQVSDTGLGIAQEHLEKIFQRFYRINTEGGRSQEGTGIGLAMVKELVSLHKGQISVESKVGTGSTFTVSLPLERNQRSAALHLDKTAGNTGVAKAFVDEATKWDLATNGKPMPKDFPLPNKPKVIVADDNQDMREYISRVLSDDFEIHLARNGEEAFKKSQDIYPDLIVSDIMMPKLDGFGLLKKLKADLSTKNIPLIFLSARAGEESKVDGIHAGADDYLVKPFSAKELLARVGNQIAINKTRQDTERGFYKLFLQLPAHIHVFSGPDHVVEFFHPLGKMFISRDITGQKIREALPELAGQGYFELLDKVFQTGETVSIPASRAVFPGKDGKEEEFYFSITYLPWRNNSNRIQGVLQFTVDVTEQTKAALKIKESEERFKILANSIPQFVWIANDKGHIEFMSDQWEGYSGMPVAEGMKMFSSLIHEEDVTEVRQKWALALQSLSAWTSEFRLRNIQTGEYRWFFGHTVPVTDEQGKLVKWIGSASDIHRQKTLNFELEALVAERTSALIELNKVLVQKNEDLSNAQYFLHTVLDSSIEVVTAFDTKLNFTYVNKRFNEVSDRRPEQLIGRNLLQVDPGFEESERYPYLLRALNGEVVHIEERRPDIDGGRVFETFLIPLKHHGQVTGVVTMQRDITTLINLTEDLKASNEQLKRSNEDLQQFAHVTSHDLKEPVRKIRMYGNILLTDFARYLPENGKEYLTKIDKATTRISWMIDGILQYATVEATEQFLQEIDLNNILQSIVEDLEIPVKEFSADVTYGVLPKMKGYPTLIYQLFYNLINNALKFRKPEVSPQIRIYSEDVSALDDSEFNGQYFKIVVEDNGVGFDQQYANKIFESFTRLHSKDKYEGTGLGLALCRKIVIRHGGHIRASGELNRGAKFSVFFPLAILV